MKVLSLIFIVITLLYGGLSLFAATVQLKQKKSAASSSMIMIIGAALIIIVSLIQNTIGAYSIYLLILGLVLIHISAILNGLRLYGKLTVKHHIVRAIISIAILILYLLS